MEKCANLELPVVGLNSSFEALGKLHNPSELWFPLQSLPHGPVLWV